MAGGDDLLCDLVSGLGQPRVRGKVCIDEIEEQSLGCIAELMGPLHIEQPCEYVRELLLMGAVMHHPEHVELLGEAP